MFDRTKEFVKRHKRGITISLSIAGAAFATYHYAQSRLRELNAKQIAQKKNAEDLKMRFERVQKDCTNAVCILLPTISEHLHNWMDVERLTSDLQLLQHSRTNDVSYRLKSPDTSLSADNSQISHNSKIDLWKNLVTLSLTRLLTAVYVQILLSFLLKLQFNLLAGDKKSKQNFTDGEEKAYLALSWYILNDSARCIMDRTRTSVTKHLSPLSLSESISPLVLKNLLINIHKDVLSQDEKFASLLLPPSQQEISSLVSSVLYSSNVNPPLPSNMNTILSELQDWIVSCPDTDITLNSIISESIENHLLSVILSESTTMTDNTLPLVKWMPSWHRSFQRVTSSDLAKNDILRGILLRNAQLDLLCANIFTSH